MIYLLLGSMWFIIGVAMSLAGKEPVWEPMILGAVFFLANEVSEFVKKRGDTD